MNKQMSQPKDAMMAGIHAGTAIFCRRIHILSVVGMKADHSNQS